MPAVPSTGSLHNYLNILFINENSILIVDTIHTKVDILVQYSIQHSCIQAQRERYELGLDRLRNSVFMVI